MDRFSKVRRQMIRRMMRQMIRRELRMDGEWLNGGNSEWGEVNGTRSDQSRT